MASIRWFIHSSTTIHVRRRPLVSFRLKSIETILRRQLKLVVGEDFILKTVEAFLQSIGNTNPTKMFGSMTIINQTNHGQIGLQVTISSMNNTMHNFEFQGSSMLDSLRKDINLEIIFAVSEVGQFVRENKIEIRIKIRARTPGYESFEISETPSFVCFTVCMTSFSNDLLHHELVEIETLENLSSGILSRKVFASKRKLVSASIVPNN